MDIKEVIQRLEYVDTHMVSLVSSGTYVVEVGLYLVRAATVQCLSGMSTSVFTICDTEDRGFKVAHNPPEVRETASKRMEGVLNGINSDKISSLFSLHAVTVKGFQSRLRLCNSFLRSMTSPKRMPPALVARYIGTDKSIKFDIIRFDDSMSPICKISKEGVIVTDPQIKEDTVSKLALASLMKHMIN